MLIFSLENLTRDHEGQNFFWSESAMGYRIYPLEHENRYQMESTALQAEPRYYYAMRISTVWWIAWLGIVMMAR